VAPASAGSREVLREALKQTVAGDAEYRSWIEEAIIQIDQVMGRSSG
jgi:hypothetical protein